MLANIFYLGTTSWLLFGIDYWILVFELRSLIAASFWMDFAMSRGVLPSLLVISFFGPAFNRRLFVLQVYLGSRLETELCIAYEYPSYSQT